MAPDSGTIETDVDKLVNIVQKEKEISMIDVAKKLRVPLQTVDAWATFLEEEGILNITYKFTTPYLVLAKPKDKKEVKTIRSEHVAQIIEALKQGYTHLLKRELNLAKEKDIEAKLKIGSLPEEIEVNNPEIVDELNKSEKKMHLMIIKFVPSSEDEISKEIEALENMENKLSESIVVETSVDEKITRMSKLIEECNRHISKSDFNNARQDYDKIKAVYGSLPEDALEKKPELSAELMMLNREIDSKMEQKFSEDAAEGYKQISSLLNDAQKAVKKKDFESAKDLYIKIKNKYAALPEGFAEKKLSLQKNVLEVYGDLAVKFEEGEKEVNKQAKEIIDLADETKRLIKQGKIPGAIKEYNKVRESLPKVPSGFFGKKIKLYEDVIELGKKMQMEEEALCKKGVESVSQDAEDLITKGEELLKQNNIKASKEVYLKVNEAYVKMPPGFDEKKAELQKKILKFNKELVDAAETADKSESADKINKIKALMKDVYVYLKQNNKDLATRSYDEIVYLMSSLPKHVLEGNADLKKQAGIVYQRIAISPNSGKLEKIDEPTKQRYNDILDQILKLNEMIKQGNFELLKKKYEEALSTYNMLPVGFIKTRSKINEDMGKIGNAINLYNALNEAGKLYDAGKYTELKEKLQDINNKYNALAKNTVGFQGLLGLARKKHTYYLNLLRKKRGAPKEAKPVFNNIIKKSEKSVLLKKEIRGQSQDIKILNTILRKGEPTTSTKKGVEALSEYYGIDKKVKKRLFIEDLKELRR